MKMRFKLEESADLNPAVVTSLKFIHTGSFSYQYYKLRHPGAIYNLMVAKLIDSISFLCKELSEHKVENLKSGFRLVLHDFFQFYESCYEIMLCFCEQNDLPKEGEFLHTWLKKKGYSVGQNFYDAVRCLIQDLKDIHNAIKHSSNDIQFIIFKNKTQYAAAYFLDMPKAAYKSPLNPISICREMRRIYFLIYFISEKLEEALRQHLSDVYCFELLHSNELIKDDVFKKLRDSINSLNEFYLLSEIGQSVYHYSIIDNSILFTEEIISEKLFEAYYNNGINMEMYFTVDGCNNSVFVPSCDMIQIGSAFYYQAKNGEMKKLTIIEC